MSTKSLAEHLEELKAEPHFPDEVQALANEAVKKTSKRLWRGFVQSTGSGLVKGALIAAAVIILAATFQTGLLAEGIIQGISFMFGKAAGLSLLGVGAAIGALADVRGYQDKIADENTQLESKVLETLRLQQQAIAVQKANSSPSAAAVASVSGTNPLLEQKTADASFAARELEKRNTGSSIGK